MTPSTKALRSLFLLCWVSLLAGSASACGTCEYSDSLGICWPYDKCLVPVVIDAVNPVKQVQAIIGVGAAIASGDPKKITQSVGSALISSANCLGCRSVAHTILPTLTDAQVNQAVGIGFLTFVATGDPVLVVIDAVTSLATQQEVRAAPTPVMPSPTVKPAVASRRAKSYTAQAECLINYVDGSTYAAWKTPASFIDTGGKSHTYPDVDLVSGDTLNVTAPICPAWNSPSTGQLSVTSGGFKFDKVSSLTGGPTVLKWFAYGKRN